MSKEKNEIEEKTENLYSVFDHDPDEEKNDARAIYVGDGIWVFPDGTMGEL